MYYRLNKSHSFRPKTPQNIAAVQKVTEYLSGRDSASEVDIRSILSGISNPHGDVVKWLARKSRQVLVPASRGSVGMKSGSPRAALNAPVRPSDPAIKLGIWSNPNNVDLDKPLIYRIEMWSEDGKYFDYIGKARDASRLKEYDRNMKKIHERRERGKTQKYRAVHYALYQAIHEGWKCECYPMENCGTDQLNFKEQQLIFAYPCTLNGGRGWRVADIHSISIEALIR